MHCYQLHSPCIPAAYQPALTLEFARNQELDYRDLLPGTGLTAADLAAQSLTPAGYLRLLHNLATALPDGDTAFLLGQTLLPGHQGPISHALLQARNLGQALELLLRYQAWLSPLLAPHLMRQGEQTLLYWTDSCVSARQRTFLVEMMMAAVSGMARWLSGQRLPWQYSFNRTRPAHPEQYAVHLGSQVQFNAYLDAMAIASHWLEQPWPRGSEMGVQMALAAAEREIGQQPRRSLLAAVYDYLHEHIRQSPSLEQCSAALGTSPATLKRHLAAHDTHFQAELDQVRTHVTLELIHNRGYSNEQIATHLGFHDANNFRRSFKRWTGLTPSVFRSHLFQLQASE